MAGSQFVWLYFGLSGRVDRVAYAYAAGFLYLARAFALYRIFVASNEEEAVQWGGTLVFIAIVTIYPQIALAAKRLHDFNKPGWSAILFVAADFLMFLWLCIPRGTPGANQYGQTTNRPK